MVPEAQRFRYHFYPLKNAKLSGKQSAFASTSLQWLSPVRPFTEVLQRRATTAARRLFSTEYRNFALWIFTAFIVSFAQSCRKGDIDSGLLPDTHISYETINLSGENRLNSQFRLSWYGTVQDGYIEGFELSQNGEDWDYTEEQDSVFIFEIPPGEDTADIDFYVRAIDNRGQVDPDPAYLSIPIKNLPPEVFFLNERGPGDTAFIAVTLYWSAEDPDGNETIENIELKVNDGDWVSIDLKQNLITLLPEVNVQSGEANAALYYGTSTAPANVSLNGIEVGGTNQVYIRATDIAQAQSEVDTAASFYFRPKSANADVLWISGHTESVTDQYRGLLQASGINYDLLNLGAQQGANIPQFIDPTVKLIFAQYSQAFLNLSPTSFNNPVTGQDQTLLNYLVPVIQGYTDDGGKYFLTTSFQKGEDLSRITNIYPISGLVTSSTPGSQARITRDSALVPLLSGNYPSMQPSNDQFGIVPIFPSSDAQPFYRGQLTRFRGWDGESDMMACVRRQNGNISEVFFAQELHHYTSNPSAVEQLISEIFDNEF